MTKFVASLVFDEVIEYVEEADKDSDESEDDEVEDGEESLFKRIICSSC